MTGHMVMVSELKEMLYEVRYVKSREDMFLALAGHVNSFVRTTKDLI